ncbi:MAG: H-NS histone family protein [Pseudomonadota bacterium]
MSIKLDKMSSKELRQLIEDAQAALVVRKKLDKKDALAAAQKAAGEFGFALDELVGTKGKIKAQPSAAPKYRSPEDPSKTWTGKGRQPDWFKEAVAAGVPQDDMLI